MSFKSVFFKYTMSYPSNRTTWVALAQSMTQNWNRMCCRRRMCNCATTRLICSKKSLRLVRWTFSNAKVSQRCSTSPRTSRRSPSYSSSSASPPPSWPACSDALPPAASTRPRLFLQERNQAGKVKEKLKQRQQKTQAFSQSEIAQHNPLVWLIFVFVFCIGINDTDSFLHNH